MPRHYENTDVRRRQVAQAALRTIAEEGVGSFTTRAVASRVGISDGTLFRHFGNKQEIALEAMQLLDQELDAGIVQTGDALADLEAFFRHRAGFVGDQASVGRLIFSDEIVHLAGEAGREVIQGWRRRSVDFLVRRLAQLAAEGRLSSELDLPAMSMIFQGALLTFAMQASLGTGGTRDALLARVEHAWNAIYIVLTP